MERDVEEALNRQINLEFFSAYFYLAIANFYKEKNLLGFGSWFTVQTQEERDHALLIVSYLQDNDAPVELKEIAAPEQDFLKREAPFREPLKLAFAHERAVTQSIHRAYELAAKGKDYRTMKFLDWFIKEQGEEEKSTGDLLDRFDLFGSDPRGLYLLDSELLGRVYAPPAMEA